MVEQLADRDRRVDRQRRQVASSPAIEAEPAVLDEGEDQGRGERLRHARDGERCVRGHRAAAATSARPAVAGQIEPSAKRMAAEMPGMPVRRPEALEPGVEGGPQCRASRSAAMGWPERTAATVGPAGAGSGAECGRRDRRAGGPPRVRRRATRVAGPVGEQSRRGRRCRRRGSTRRGRPGGQGEPAPETTAASDDGDERIGGRRAHDDGTSDMIGRTIARAGACTIGR